MNCTQKVGRAFLNSRPFLNFCDFWQFSYIPWPGTLVVISFYYQYLFTGLHILRGKQRVFSQPYLDFFLRYTFLDHIFWGRLPSSKPHLTYFYVKYFSRDNLKEFLGLTKDGDLNEWIDQFGWSSDQGIVFIASQEEKVKVRFRFL